MRIESAMSRWPGGGGAVSIYVQCVKCEYIALLLIRWYRIFSFHHHQHLHRFSQSSQPLYSASFSRFNQLTPTPISHHLHNTLTTTPNRQNAIHTTPRRNHPLPNCHHHRHAYHSEGLPRNLPLCSTRARRHRRGPHRPSSRSLLLPLQLRRQPWQGRPRW